MHEAKFIQILEKILDEKLQGFATKDDLKRFATKDDLKRFATKDDLKRFATKDDLKDIRANLNNLKDDVQTLKSDLVTMEHRLVNKIDTCLTRKEFMYFMEYQFVDVVLTSINDLEKETEDLRDSTSRHDMQIDRLREMITSKK